MIKITLKIDVFVLEVAWLNVVAEKSKLITVSGFYLYGSYI